MKLSKHKMSVFSQMFKLIPGNLIPKLAAKHGVDKRSRTFTPTSHVHEPSGLIGPVRIYSTAKY